MLSNKKNITYGYSDVSLVPSIVTDIIHRSECNPLDKFGKLPIFTAPMSTIINENNFDVFDSNLIHAILPRNVNLEIRKKFIQNGKWVALSLNEFESLIINDESLINCNANEKHILIDVANGHMKILYDLSLKAKHKYGDKIKIMVGNIANPLTYEVACKAKVDYIRLNIGSGSACITSSNTGIHYGAASLINDVKCVKENAIVNSLITEGCRPKIVADGGIRNYSDVIKALALGADYVMIGGLFASLLESAAPMYTQDDDGNEISVAQSSVRISNGVALLSFNNDNKNSFYYQPKYGIYKKYYGMASRQGQIDLYGSKQKTSEGIERVIVVTTNVVSWSENMADYIKSAMSYLNLKTLPMFNIEQTNICLLSNVEQQSINR